MAGTIDVVSLYSKDTNIYGDSGNVLTIRHRLELYGYEPVVHQYNQGDDWSDQVDLILGGGGQDADQKKIIGNFYHRADLLRSLAADSTPMLVIYGLYQLFGEYFETVDGTRLDGIGVIGAYTVGQNVHMIGNLVEHSDRFGDVIGYENHSGQTLLHEGVQLLGTVNQDGRDNDGEDHTEGACVHNVIGAYVHGSLLPKNSAISDFLIETAVTRHYGTFDTSDQTSEQAKEFARPDQVVTNAHKAAAECPR